MNNLISAVVILRSGDLVDSKALSVIYNLANVPRSHQIGKVFLLDFPMCAVALQWEEDPFYLW